MDPLDLPLTRSIALTPDNVWFVDLQWYRKMEQEDLFLKNVYCIYTIRIDKVWPAYKCELTDDMLVCWTVHTV